jgi:hypothetical protein
MRELAGAVAEMIHGDTGFAQHGQKQVVHGCFFGVADVAASLDFSGRAANQDKR